MGWNRRRSLALVGFAAVAGLLLAVVPAFGDSHPDAVRLHLGTDGEYFEYEDTQQELTSTRCEINETDGPVMALDASRKVGLNSFGIGVKSGGAQGTPCGRVDATESLTLSVPETGDLSGRFFDGAQLDLELKGDARVIATLHNDSDSTFAVFELGSGSSIETGEDGDVPAEQDDDGVFRAESTDDFPNVACGAQSDSGPDAGARDNCLWTITTAFEFNRIVLSAEVGEFSLEGSGDYGNDPAFDSLFFIANAAPVAADDTASTDEDTSISTSTDFDVLANDSDADDDTLTVTAVGTTGTTGTVTVDGSGNITYDPNGQFEALNNNESDIDSFDYTVSDGNEGTDTATVTVTVNGVNDAPVLTASSATTNEDTAVDITLNFADPDDSVFTTSCSSSDGTWADDTTNKDGSGTFTPTADFNGTASLSCTVTDEQGAKSNTETVTVTVNAVNDAPIANDDEYSTSQNTVLTVNAAEGVLADDTDADGDTLTAVVVSGPSNGSLSLATDGSFTYTPDKDFVGSESFTYKANDGTADSNTATVSIEVTLGCDENAEFSGEGEPTYTVRPENGGADCEKEVTEYDAGVDADGNPFVKLVTSGDTTVVFLERLELEPQVFPGDPQTPSLYYDDDFSDGIQEDHLAPYCLLDPRIVVDGEPIFDLHADYDSAEPGEADEVLPSGETTCIISAEFSSTGQTDDNGNPLVESTYWLYNQNDGFRTFK